MLDSLVQFDRDLLIAINQGWNSPILDAFMTFISEQWVWIAVAVFFVGRACWRRDWYFVKMAGLMIVMTIIADAISYHWLKPNFGRLRPCLEFKELIRTVNSCAGQFSFPSNHATNGAVVATLALAFKGLRWGAIWWGIVFLIGLSRIYLGVHYPADITMGFIFGATVSGIAIAAVYWIKPLNEFFKLRRRP